MSDPSVDRWKPTGHVYLWRRDDELRNYPGWNMSCDRDGCGALVKLFTMMRDAKWGSKKLVKIARPPDMLLHSAARVKSERVIVPPQIEFRYPKDQIDPFHWSWVGNWMAPSVTFGAQMLEELRSALNKISDGIGDFRVGAENQALHGLDPQNVSIWFWPVTKIAT